MKNGQEPNDGSTLVSLQDRSDSSEWRDYIGKWYMQHKIAQSLRSMVFFNLYFCLKMSLHLSTSSYIISLRINRKFSHSVLLFFCAFSLYDSYNSLAGRFIASCFFWFNSHCCHVILQKQSEKSKSTVFSLFHWGFVKVLMYLQLALSHVISKFSCFRF